jgi:SAM-dependent methyltransferase
LVNNSLRRAAPVQRRLYVLDPAGTWNQPERRHQSRAGQRLQRRLLVAVEIHHTPGGTEKHADDTVATGDPSGDASVAIHVQHIIPSAAGPACRTVSRGTDTFLMSNPSREVYSHGHHDSVLRSHRWRTAGNSAAYLLPRLNRADRLLDVGIGPGTITLDLARRLPQGWVVGIDAAPAAVAATKTLAASRGAGNVRLLVGDVYQLGFADGSFDVVHAHQLVQHLADPVVALREMRRVCEPGGLVAVRDADYSAMTWHPPSAALIPMAPAVPRGGPLKRGRTRCGTPAAQLGAGRWLQRCRLLGQRLVLRYANGYRMVVRYLGRAAESLRFRSSSP